MLARGELRCIGATTLAEHRQHMEKDAAFERRFQQVLVGEPSVQVRTLNLISVHCRLQVQFLACLSFCFPSALQELHWLAAVQPITAKFGNIGLHHLWLVSY